MKMARKNWCDHKQGSCWLSFPRLMYDANQCSQGLICQHPSEHKGLRLWRDWLQLSTWACSEVWPMENKWISTIETSICLKQTRSSNLQHVWGESMFLFLNSGIRIKQCWAQTFKCWFISNTHSPDNVLHFILMNIQSQISKFGYLLRR